MRLLLTPIVVLTLLAAGSGNDVSAGESARQLVPLDGQPYAARLTSIDADWKLTFERDDGSSVELSADELVRWGHPAPHTRGSVVLTVAGGRLSGTLLMLGNKHLLLDAPKLFNTQTRGLQIPLSAIEGMVLRVPPDVKRLDSIAAKLRAQRPQTDVVTLVNGDRISGTVAEYDEARPDGGLRVRGEGGERNVPVEDVASLALNAALVKSPRLSDPRVIVSLAGGNRLLVTSAEVLTGGDAQVRLQVAGGFHVDVEKLKDIVGIQPLGGRVTYLSDLEPAAYRHVPYLKLAWPFHADRNAEGGPLRAGGQTYIKGLGMHSPSRLTYRLDGKQQRFQAQVAVDESAGRDGSVRALVYVLDGQQWKQAFASDTIRGGDKPLDVSVDVSGARAITLVVDPADRGDQRDLANWLDARLIRE